MEIGQQQAAHTVAEAATMLGVSQWLIREAIRRGEIRSVRPSCVPRGKAKTEPAAAASPASAENSDEYYDDEWDGNF